MCGCNASHRVCDESGDVEITRVGQAPLDYDLLDSDDAFILDMGNSGVYAWIGKGATQQERNQAFMHAQVGAITPVCSMWSSWKRCSWCLGTAVGKI